ncbi:glycosyltransferase [Amycolatopsis sp. WAC 01416]|uniref:glycosyltransferase family 2 protein n=1 Tax=Amycolatopsis sp. WAC 01416 TaxID=2203196 RepID=UPI000F7A949B|nr:glycosyltransferase family A protein [Amycolatopsis sp. WAC 01416]RSN32350.1 glycosyltransferase [Amycolatopsis sp. WAC 01416]
MRRLRRIVAAALDRRHAENGEIAALRSAIADQAAEIERLRAVLEHHNAWLEDHGGALRDGDARATTVEARQAALDTRQEALDGWLKSHDTAFEGLHLRAGSLEAARDVRTFTHWLDQHELRATPKISIVLPTHDRAALLPRAVASVRAQRYPHWELVIVDDASSDSTPKVIAGFEDPRIRSIRVEHGGVCAARNAGLAEVTGDVVAYLDDDNTLHPLWLKALGWAFGEHPEITAAYGGFVIDDIGGLPELFLRRYDRETLLRENLADIGAVAHRAGLPQARFDESLVEMGDWDLLLALTADREPLVVPAISCYYTTTSGDRLSHGPTYDDDFAAIRRKHSGPEHRS